MALTAWVAKHTGLPSFAVTGTVDHRVYRLSASDGRRAWEVPFVGNGDTVLFSDALAQPGVEVTYTFGSVHRKLTRPTPVANGETEWWRGMVSRRDGRIIPELAWEKNGDPRDWSSPIKSFNSRIARWGLLDDAVTGSGVFVLFDPEQAADTWSLFQAHEPLIVFPGAPADSLPPRVILVDKVGSKRITGNGWIEFTVSWSELPTDSPLLNNDDAYMAPVVNWGEYESFAGTWGDYSYHDLCVRIAGMPS